MPSASSRADKRARLLHLVRTHDACVLATVGAGEHGQPVPHCSLMAYLPGDEPIRELYLLTSRQTRKFENLVRHPRVSLLIDSREEDRGKPRGQARALTIAAEAEVVADAAGSGDVKRRLAERCPHLAGLAAQADTVVVRLRFKEFTYLEGVEDVFREEICD